MKKRIGWKATLTALAIVFALSVMVLSAMNVEAAGTKSKAAINKDKVTVCCGKSYTLKMTGISKKVKWSTSDKDVVSITKKSGKKAQNCKIKANKKGTATVTAKVKVGKKTKTFKCQVTVKGHTYGKVTYKWNKDYSKCTASKKCSRCGKTLKQTVKTTCKTTKKATCTAKGKKTYTAKFTKYDFGTKKKNVSTKALGHSADTNKKISYKWNEDLSKCTATFYCKAGGEKVTETVKSTKKTTPATTTVEGKIVYTVTFKTKGLKKQTFSHNLECEECEVTTVFTPGDYTFGEIGYPYTYRGYMGWGKYKGTYPDSAKYVEYCSDKEEYDKYKSFFENQTLRDGTTGTLEDVAAQTEIACWERADYKSKADIEWDALSYDVKKNIYDDEFRNYMREKYGEAGVTYYNSVGIGFGYKVTSNAHLKQIVDDWTAVSGEKPSWYYNEDGSIYYTAFSDWAEWCGRDINAGIYSECPVLPDNFRD